MSRAGFAAVDRQQPLAGDAAGPMRPLRRTAAADRALALVCARLALDAAVGSWRSPSAGYASPLYPAAGIALASVLVYGWRMLGAVALGAFCVNAAGRSPRAARTSRSPSPCRPASPSAAALQAGVGAALVRRFVRQPLTLTDAARRRRASSPAARSAACVGASVATVAAARRGDRRAGERCALTWGTWWIGDLAGAADRDADRPDPDRPAARGVGAAPRPGRPDAGAGDRLPRPRHRPGGALERRAAARRVRARRRRAPR